jgi:AraC-like DNA-binding protein
MYSKSITLNTIPYSTDLYSIKFYEGEIFPLPFHNHHYYEITLILKGKGIRFIGDSVGEFKEGEVVFIGPNLSHQWRLDTDYQEKSVKAISIFFHEDFPIKGFKDIAEMATVEELKRKAKYGLKLFGKLEEIISEKMKSMLQNQGLSSIINLLDVLHSISRSRSFHTLSSLQMEPTSNLSNRRINMITEYIDANLNSKITLNELAEIACMHRSSVGRFFKKSVGFSLIEYINLLRIGKACRLLTHSNEKIKDIAIKSGFENISHFNNQFKKLKKLSPKQYRTQKFTE